MALSNQVLKTCKYRVHNLSRQQESTLNWPSHDLFPPLLFNLNFLNHSLWWLATLSHFCSTTSIIVSRSHRQVVKSPLAHFFSWIKSAQLLPFVLVGHVLSAFDCLSSPILDLLQFLNIRFIHYILPFCTLISLKINSKYKYCVIFSKTTKTIISNIFQGISEPKEIGY